MGVPANPNLLQNVGFQFILPRAPNFNYFIQKVALPGLTLPSIKKQTPFGYLNLPGDHLEFEDLSITFKIDEDFQGYFEIFDWMTALGFPESFEQSKTIYDRVQGIDILGVYNTASLFVLDNQMNPNVEFKFADVQPKFLGGPIVQSDVPDITYITATATFSFRLMTYNLVF